MVCVTCRSGALGGADNNVEPQRRNDREAAVSCRHVVRPAFPDRKLIFPVVWCRAVRTRPWILAGNKPGQNTRRNGE